MANMIGALEKPDADQGGGIRPFAAFDRRKLDQVRFVLTDIDDTLTDNGRLPAIAYEALERLTEAGITVIPVTGRPAGWCDMIARLWPVGAVVGENGAFYFACRPGKGMLRVFAKSAETRRTDREKLEELAETIFATVPEARLSADQNFREADLAIDFAEDGPLLGPDKVQRIVDCFEAAGATAKFSSIHVNGWYGTYDKLAMSRRLLGELYGVDIAADNERVIFVGDSPNDAPMFGYFENSIAVANFAKFRDEVAEQPKWITRKAGGAGFAEVAEALLQAKADG
jgi:HAD superfamily hydrolase (TIGR01484 family)